MCFGISCSKDDSNLGFINEKYLNIPDPSFEALLIEHNIDTDGEINQQILKKEAEEVTSLDLSSLSLGSINDLTGIEGFINLKKLIVTQHDIEQIDISKNTLLDTLYLGGNKLATIDISENRKLKLLDIQANELTSITGLSNLTSLKNLDLSWNYLETLTVDNELLEVLHVRNNNLKTININSVINLINLLLTANQLTSIDISANKLLKTLVIPNNKIESIDLEKNSNLTHLYVFDNSLLSLDVSNNQKLVDLQIGRNPDLSCIKIRNNQNIPRVSKSDYQELNVVCN